jgi:RNA polymerase sigma-54 factor
MKPSLQLKLSQHLALTPQLQQSIRLLQLSTLELEHELEKYLLDNPLLEREEEYSRPEAAQGDRGADEAPGPDPSDERGEHSSPDDEGWLDDPTTPLGSSGS